MVPGLSSYTYTWAVGVPGSMPEKPLTAVDLIDETAAASLRLLQIADNLSVEGMVPEDLKEVTDYAQSRNVNLELGRRGLKEFIKEDWKKVFDPENVKEQIRSIT